MNDASYTVQFPNNQKLVKLAGLLDIEVEVSTTDFSTETMTATVKSSCGAIDLVALYPTEITTNGAGAIWHIYNETDGVSVPITAITSNSTTGVVTFTVDNMALSAGARLSVWLGTNQLLTNAGIIGFSNTENNKATSIVVP